MSTTESDTPAEGIDLSSAAEDEASPRLSAREAQILGLIVRGLSVQEIAEVSSLSVNSVQTYVGTGYRKMGVTGRSQAVVWAMRHGFDPGPSAGQE